MKGLEKERESEKRKERRSILGKQNERKKDSRVVPSILLKQHQKRRIRSTFSFINGKRMNVNNC